MTNALAYFGSVDKSKSFRKLDPGATVIRLFTAVIYEFS
jgi:hypothetical protein